MARGSYIIERNGYLMAYVGKGRYRYQHRLVMEAALFRPLERHEIVHHKNGDKHDNRLENLELTTQSEHMKDHYRAGELGAFGSKGAGSRSHLRKPDIPCAWCGKPFHQKAKRLKCCSQSCGQKLRQQTA